MKTNGNKEIIMNITKILAHCDHTLLSQTSRWEDIKKICDEGIEYSTASVCIPPCFVKEAKKYVGEKLAICTVIGFPNGYMTTAVKAFETQDAVNNGADEIDMVINIGKVKEKNYDYILEEIRAVRKQCEGKILKVIIETCFLDDEEIVKLSQIVTESGADYIKTSTGFGGEGANFHVVELMKKSIGKNVKVKAAGGISSLEDAEKFMELGADRLGTSRIVKLVKGIEAKTGY